jgi:hypothetical protein
MVVAKAKNWAVETHTHTHTHTQKEVNHVNIYFSYNLNICI